MMFYWLEGIIPDTDKAALEKEGIIGNFGPKIVFQLL